MTVKTLFVLGAGASKPYGMPLGSELRGKLLALTSPGVKPTDMGTIVAGSNGQPYDEAFTGKFHREFRDSATLSIDSFLARRTEYMELGKALIAILLLNAEQEAKLASGIEGDWYSHFWQRVSTNPWKTFDLSRYAIVTFNYDRTFEVFLIRAMMATYGKTYEECLAQLMSMDICHVYGDLGEIPGKSEEFETMLAHGAREDLVRKAYERIELMAEHRNATAGVVRAREHVRSANRLVFLGFGYDDLNLKRLTPHDTRIFVGEGTFEELPLPDQLFGTVYGMASGAKVLAYRNLRQAFGVESPNASYRAEGELIYKFVNASCLEALARWPFL